METSLVASTDHLKKPTVQVKPSLSRTQVFKHSLDKSLPSLLASSPLLLVILVLVTTTSSPWTLVVALLLMDSTTFGIFSPLWCTWQTNSVSLVRFRCTSTLPTLMSVDATTMPARSLPEVPATKNSLRKSQSTSLHVMSLVWSLTHAPTLMELHTKPSPAHERQAHEWAHKFPVSFRNLFVRHDVLENVFIRENYSHQRSTELLIGYTQPLQAVC